MGQLGDHGYLATSVVGGTLILMEDRLIKEVCLVNRLLEERMVVMRVPSLLSDQVLLEGLFFALV